jgi:hypothetical protein
MTREALANLMLLGSTPVTDKRATVHNSRPLGTTNALRRRAAPILTFVLSFSIFVLAQRRTSCGDLGSQT